MCQGISTPSGHAQHNREALASIVLAAISSESFINELAEAAVLAPEPPAHLKALGTMLAEAEKSRVSVESKYHLAKFVLTGEPFDKGASPYQEFALLIDLRNRLLHSKPLEAKLVRNDEGEFVWTEPPLMRRLQSARIVHVDNTLKEAAKRNNADVLIADMLHQVSSQGVALWACRAVSAIVNNLLDSLPTGSQCAALAEIAYRRSFQIL
jgi:hypothetical protein